MHETVAPLLLEPQDDAAVRGRVGNPKRVRGSARRTGGPLQVRVPHDIGLSLAGNLVEASRSLGRRKAPL